MGCCANQDNNKFSQYSCLGFIVNSFSYCNYLGTFVARSQVLVKCIDCERRRRNGASLLSCSGMQLLLISSTRAVLHMYTYTVFALNCVINRYK